MAQVERNGEDREWGRLMAAAQDGDARAYECLLLEIQPLIRRIVAPSHRNADRAEDVVQDVLLALHRVRHTYDPTRPFSHWLAAIARRRSIDALRRKGRIDLSEISDDIAYETYSDPIANRILETRQKSDALRSAIATLPSTQRKALELLKLREMSLAEASAETGKSVSALKVAVHRAVKALRLRMSGE
ncbi:MAG TPA: sigma-70 family RNA polymerase sigma factor [Aliidongia sp.]|nr:sigma-70 family RNA polymerase sigma factor [Aliidongia sp.]